MKLYKCYSKEMHNGIHTNFEAIKCSSYKCLGRCVLPTTRNLNDWSLLSTDWQHINITFRVRYFTSLYHSLYKRKTRLLASIADADSKGLSSATALVAILQDHIYGLQTARTAFEESIRCYTTHTAVLVHIKLLAIDLRRAQTDGPTFLNDCTLT